MEQKLTISLVTPCLDQVDLIDSAISSVVDQDFERLEYVVVDGASSDGSVDVIRSYEDRLAYWVSEPDDGHYAAVNKGFARTTGEIMGYLNGDDVLLPGSLALIADIFESFPDVEWLTGAYVSIDRRGRPVGVTQPRRWSRWHLITTATGRALPQEATFWRRSLWDRAGGKLDESFPLAGDFELWARFSRYAAPTTIRAPLACFRHMPGQRSVAQADRYWDEAARIRKREVEWSSQDTRAAGTATRLLRWSSKAGLDKAAPVVDSVLGAPEELLYDPGTDSFYRRGHSGRAANLMRKGLTGLVGRRFKG